MTQYFRVVAEVFPALRGTTSCEWEGSLRKLGLTPHIPPGYGEAVIDLRIALAGAACLVVLGAGCTGCVERAEMAAAAPDASTWIPSSIRPPSERAETAPVAPDAGAPEPSHDLGRILPLSGSVTGPRDETNHYPFAASARAVMTEDGPRYRECAAVLVARNLVLTAAHCMCVPTGSETLRFDGSQCAKKANIRAYISVPPDRGATLSWLDVELAGDISIHPRFELVLDAQGDVVSSHADLAAIRLEEPGVPEIQPLRLATSEAAVGDVVSVVGYDFIDQLRSMTWFRRFTREEVHAPVGDDRFSFGALKFADFKTDTGGPCLRETERGQELVGISQRGLGRVPAFTRIAPYREWVEEQIRLSGEKP